MLNFIKRLVHEEEGQGIIEYGLLAAFISIAAIVAIKLIGPQVKTFFENVQTELAKP